MQHVMFWRLILMNEVNNLKYYVNAFLGPITTTFGLFLVIFLGMALSTQSVAKNFSPGDVVFVSFPAANIKDDAFIIGKVQAIMPNQDYRISVLDYVEGHDYGSSCIPMVKNEPAQAPQTPQESIAVNWELWPDTTTLDTKKLDYVVAKKDVVALSYGKTYFVERNNLSIVFGRWLSDAPLLNIDRINRAQAQAKSIGLNEMSPAFELAKLHRASFYGDFGRPLLPHEAISPLVTALKTVQEHLQKNPELFRLWQARPRNWQAINESTKTYFLVEAIDKIISDAQDQLYEDIEDADKNDIEQLKRLLNELKRG